ncbi:hypothetical protein [Rhodococcus sp. I2R]|uniref:hypothetical protein n=1 Tax=Rhodococcus sp. I2R TaxID=2855445 RepID=UPI001E4E4BAD|nr:hypothetical protein [Rhodococcus sp. I2R]MCC8930838.1 hypothetical protein [Rhodococcus sp. I2R]
MTTVFQEMAVLQLLILLTLWGFAIDVVYRRIRHSRSQRRQTTAPPQPEASSQRSWPVAAYIVAGIALFAAAIAVLALIDA